MLRRFIPSSSVLVAGTTSAFRFAGQSTHFRDSKDKHPLQGVIPSVRRAGEAETFTLPDGRTIVYEYPAVNEIWSEEECRSVTNDTRPRRNFLDSSAYWSIQLIRFAFDVFSGYSFGKLTKTKILRRVLFLECAAGIPGAVAGTLRHLKSLRTMKRDHGWIATLLNEAENERMHMAIASNLYRPLGKPGIFMRFCVLITQGVMWNMFFVMYIATGGKWCHRFVGYLEESAVYTYTHVIEAMENPKNKELYEWGQEDAPQIAKNYWKMKADAKVVDVFLQILADESAHRDVNHCLGDLRADQVNPFVSHDEVHRPLQEKIKEKCKQQQQQEFAPRDPSKHDADPYFTEEELGISKNQKSETQKVVAAANPYAPPSTPAAAAAASSPSINQEKEVPTAAGIEEEGKVLTKKVGGASSSSSSSASTSPNKDELYLKSVLGKSENKK